MGVFNTNIFGGSFSGKNVSMINGRVFIDGVEQGAGMGGSAVQGSGPAVERSIPVGEFSAVESDLPISISWARGAPGAKLTAAENLHSAIEVAVAGNVLVVKAKSNYSGSASLVISSRMIDQARLGGACQMDVKGLAGDSFDAKVSGAAKLSAEGAVASVRVKASGSAEVRAGGLAASRAAVTLSGSSEAQISFSKEGSVDCSGSSECSARADGEVSVDCSGSSEFKHGAGAFSRAKIETSGAAAADVVLSGPSNLAAGGASKISYALAPGGQAPQLRVGGSASIDQRKLRAGEGAPAHSAEPSLEQKLAQSPEAAPAAPERPPAPNTARGRR